MLSKRSMLGVMAGVVTGSLAVGLQAASPIAPPANATWLTASGKVRVVGYNDMTEMLRTICALFSARHDGIQFELELTGTKAAPAALANGRSLLAPMGAEMLPDQLTLYRQLRGSDPLMIRVAHDSLNAKARSSPTGVFVHRDNPIREISIELLKRLVTRNATQLRVWGELGLTGTWAARLIRAHGLAEGTAIGTLLRLQKFNGAPYAANVVGHSQSRDVVAAIAAEPNAIGFANLNHATPVVRSLAVSDNASGTAYAGTAANLRAGWYPLDRHLLVYLARDAHGRLERLAVELARLILSVKGQDIIASGSLGYIPLSATDVALELARLP